MEKMELNFDVQIHRFCHVQELKDFYGYYQCLNLTSHLLRTVLNLIDDGKLDVNLIQVIRRKKCYCCKRRYCMDIGKIN